MKPTLSIILPVHNGERYLRQSLESVLAQSYGKFELIIGDDNSHDRSAEIIRSCRDGRIRTFRNESNAGLFRTLNRGIGECSAEWIRLWSQDDIMKDYCLDVENEYCSSYPDVGMGLCSYDVIDSEDRLISSAQLIDSPPVFSRGKLNQLLFYRGCLPGNISTVTINKKALIETGGFNEKMRIAGDFDLWVRIAKNSSFFYVKEHLVSIRSHADQLSRRSDAYSTCMQEEKEIYEVLLSRLPGEIVNYAKWYDCLTRQPKYIHYLVRSLLSRDFRNALSAFKEIRRLDHNLLATAYWLFSANQRLFKIKPKYYMGSGNSTSDFFTFVFHTSRLN